MLGRTTARLTRQTVKAKGNALSTWATRRCDRTRRPEGALDVARRRGKRSLHRERANGQRHHGG
jgi:hypothetical protein